MTKTDFLDSLRRSLGGDVSPELIEENIRYYDEYISVAVRNGRSEEEVIAELPEPSLLAKTIKNANQGANESSSSEQGDETTRENRFHVFRTPLVLAITIIVVLLIVLLIGGFLLSLVAYVLPIFIVPIIIIVLLIAIMRRR